MSNLKHLATYELAYIRKKDVKERHRVRVAIEGDHPNGGKLHIFSRDNNIYYGFLVLPVRLEPYDEKEDIILTDEEKEEQLIKKDGELTETFEEKLNKLLFEEVSTVAFSYKSDKILDLFDLNNYTQKRTGIARSLSKYNDEAIYLTKERASKIGIGPLTVARIEQYEEDELKEIYEEFDKITNEYPRMKIVIEIIKDLFKNNDVTMIKEYLTSNLIKGLRSLKLSNAKNTPMGKDKIAAYEKIKALILKYL